MSGRFSRLSAIAAVAALTSITAPSLLGAAEHLIVLQLFVLQHMHIPNKN